jgi:hypothetical protein
MKERPIIFAGESVRAILAGRKTQTRRVVKPRHEGGVICGPAAERGAIETWGGGAWYIARHSEVRVCPYGVPGDRLYVKEGWCQAYDAITARPVEGRFLYLADPGAEEVLSIDGDGSQKWNKDGSQRSPWCSSMFMPRHVSRLLLEVTDVRVQRLQEISEEDALAEGVERRRIPAFPGVYAYYVPGGFPDGWNGASAVEAFRHAWDSINAKPKPVRVRGAIDHYVSYPWEDIRETRTRRGKPWYVYGSPWVWVVTFRRID